MKVELSREAEEQVGTIDDWWRQNRPAAPDLFLTELDDALIRLEEMPTLGTPYAVGSKTVRRLLLRRTHYHLYMKIEAEGLLVVAVWNAHRGRVPRL